MRTLTIPIARKLNTYDLPYQLAADESPYMLNCYSRIGTISAAIEKRLGASLVYEWAAPIIGYGRINNTHALVIHADALGSSTGNALKWDLTTEDATAANFVSKASGLLTGYDGDTGKYARFRHCHHFDDAVDLITVFTNGVENVLKFAHTANTLTDLIATPSDTVLAKYPATMYGSLFLTGVIKDTDGDPYPYRVIRSKVNDASNFGTYNYYQDRPEDGAMCTSLHALDDSLILGKYGPGKGSVWRISDYSNYSRISTDLTITNHDSFISANKTAYFNDRGRIRDLNGTFLSRPIHNSLATAAPGDWDEMGSAYDGYDNKLYFSSGYYIFCYDLTFNTWSIFQYPQQVRVLPNILEPGQKQAQSWAGTIDKHTRFSVVEEEIIPDVLFQMANGLYAFNHFSDDDDDPIEMVYRTPIFRIGGEDFDYGRVRAFLIEAKGSEECVVKYWYGDTPENVVYEHTADSIDLSANNGNGKADLDFRAKWCGFEITNSSTSFTRIDFTGLWVEPLGRK